MILRWTIVALLSMQAATCGQKGPLELPEPGASSNNVLSSLLP